MWNEPAEDHLGLVTRSLTSFLSCVVLANFLRCWVLSLVHVGMKMYLKVIRKRLLRFHMREPGFYF